MATDDGGRFGARIMTSFHRMRTGNDPVSLRGNSGGWWADSQLRWRGNDVFAAYSSAPPIRSRLRRWAR